MNPVYKNLSQQFSSISILFVQKILSSRKYFGKFLVKKYLGGKILSKRIQKKFLVENISGQNNLCHKINFGQKRFLDKKIKK